MTEYIVRESGYPGTIKQEIVGELIRCKDCRYWKTETEPIGIECEPGETAHYCDMDGMITRTADFCSYGHRRTADEEQLAAER